MNKLFCLSSIIALVYSQGANICYYKLGPIELDLRPLKGRTMRYEGNDGNYYYTPCQDELFCSRDGIPRMAMLDYFPAGIDECIDIANFNPLTQPRYDAFVETWWFNYTSNELCTDNNIPQTNRSVILGYNCNPDAGFAFISDVNHYDSCNDFIIVDYAGACPPVNPYNAECEFKDAGRVLNLTTIKGNYLKYETQNNDTFLYTPCSNEVKCMTPYGELYTMAEIVDRSGEQCAKYFAIWSGDTQAYYDKTVFGQDYWEFTWINGQECGEGGPNELLNVRYYCNNSTNVTKIVSAEPAGPPCQFRVDIESPLACST